jgi:hypothetical protein
LNNVDEIFKDCPYNSLVQVSQYGKVKNKSTNEIIEQKEFKGCYIVKDPRGTMRYDNGLRDFEWVHRLVALTWLTDSPSYMFGAVHHKDGNGLNNHVSNLEWVDENEHKKKHGLT